MRRHEHAGRDIDHGPVADRDAPAVRPFEPGDAAQRRGLAAAGRAEQRHDLAGADLEVDAGDGRHGFVCRRTFAEALDRIMRQRTPRENELSSLAGR